MCAFKYEKAYEFFSKFHKHSPFHRMPDHYKRTIVRMLEEDPKAVHYVPETRDWVKSPEHLLSGGWKRVENRPLHLIYPKQFHEGLWGGEAVVKGFKRPDRKFPRKIPHWWVPVLRRAVVHSEILDKYMKVVVTLRTLDLIDENFGFDFYILKTDVIDLRSDLALKLKSKMLLALSRKDLYPHDPDKREEVYNKYKQFIIPEEEAEWMGLTLVEALAKQREIDRQQKQHGPLKIQFRQSLLEELKEAKQQTSTTNETKDSWIARMNPFTKSTASNEDKQGPQQS